MCFNVKAFPTAAVLVFLGLATCVAAAAPPDPACKAASGAAAARPKPKFSRETARAIVADLGKIVSDNGVQQLVEVPIGGINQWISIRGRNRDNPVLLFIHGGPASPEMPASWAFQSGWEDYFTVAQWDQRGAGKTYNASDPRVVAPTLTVERMTADAEEVVQYLRTTYNKQKIFVLGHSWGTVLGLKIAQRHPDWLFAYIGMGQVINVQEGERVNYQFALQAAGAAGNQKALTQLRALAPYPEPDGSIPVEKVGQERAWSVFFGALTHGRTALDYFTNAALLSPDYTEADLPAIDKGAQLSLPPLLADVKKVDFTSLTELKCPLVLFLGRYDNTVPSTLAAEWYSHLKAPDKRLVWFESSAHMMHLEEPGRVLVHLVTDVRSLADTEMN